MSWDPTWEEVFRSRDWGKYPPEELIRFVGRHYYSVPDRKTVRILEVGCGEGANVWFLAREGFDAYGIDGSPTAIAKAERRLQAEGLTARLHVGDIIALNAVYPSAWFDAVVDVACLQHNGMRALRKIVDQVWGVLKPGGRVFSMLVAAGSYGDGLGKEVEPRTFVDIREGPLEGKGFCHFVTQREAEGLFADFADVAIEYALRSLNNQQQSYKQWVVQARKPA